MSRLSASGKGISGVMRVMASCPLSAIVGSTTAIDPPATEWCAEAAKTTFGLLGIGCN